LIAIARLHEPTPPAFVTAHADGCMTAEMISCTRFIVMPLLGSTANG
jgi:hypothetical protein